MTTNHPSGTPFRHHHIAGMAVGDCIRIEDRHIGYKAQAVCYYAAKKYGMKITTKELGQGGRAIWRIA